ncbi:MULTISPECIES: MerR family transcriptional regulator [Vagococcus]|uniref:MerR family transcriptional regulator n=1 Tax=Vagococcus TaxID=2737 RepID=UPI000E4D7DCE|nr:MULTISPECIES: MerR family transcriptional regulator [Vagococcus]RHH69974.1 MerR family transcriptional regulator [Vagococcus sp. AM17-17]
MYIGEFIQTFETTRETVRYYIEEGLLTPTKVNGNYFFTDLDISDFKNIRELRDMGLSIRVLKQIKKNKKDCGSKRQWEDNFQIINDELERVEKELEILAQQKKTLEAVSNQLQLVLDECSKKELENE